MNERIIEMAKQCGDWSGQTIEMNDVGITKFAELIVNECCQMMLDMETKYPANLTVREIKKHFGV
jgi:hypothetical protein